ncbi:hypothetical protein ACHELK_004143 [Vibrio vulnificus]
MKMNNRPKISTPIRGLITNGNFSRFLAIASQTSKTNSPCQIAMGNVTETTPQHSLLLNNAEIEEPMSHLMHDCERLFIYLRAERHDAPHLGVLYYRIHYFLAIVCTKNASHSAPLLTQTNISQYKAHLTSKIGNNLERKMHVDAVRFFFRQLCHHGFSHSATIRNLEL